MMMLRGLLQYRVLMCELIVLPGALFSGCVIWEPAPEAKNSYQCSAIDSLTTNDEVSSFTPMAIIVASEKLRREEISREWVPMD